MSEPTLVVGDQVAQVTYLGVANASPRTAPRRGPWIAVDQALIVELIDAWDGLADDEDGVEFHEFEAVMHRFVKAVRDDC